MAGKFLSIKRCDLPPLPPGMTYCQLFDMNDPDDWLVIVDKVGIEDDPPSASASAALPTGQPGGDRISSRTIEYPDDDLDADSGRPISRLNTALVQPQANTGPSRLHSETEIEPADCRSEAEHFRTGPETLPAGGTADVCPAAPAPTGTVYPFAAARELAALSGCTLGYAGGFFTIEDAAGRIQHFSNLEQVVSHLRLLRREAEAAGRTSAPSRGRSSAGRT